MEVLFDLHISRCDNSHLKMKEILDRVINISKTQLTNIVQRKLEKLGYVHYTPYEGVKLTSDGFKVAQKIARNHRLAEALLSQILRMPFSEIHEQACLLEHSISDEMAQYIFDALPEKITPFGISIPMAKIEEGECTEKTLTDYAEGSKVKLLQISIHTHGTAKKILNYGISGIGAEFTIKKFSKGSVTIWIKDMEYHLPLDLAKTLFVELV
ncbi:MAG: metal-dependent transcriptional regulator [Candidatus Hodarchaeales archaeon]